MKENRFKRLFTEHVIDAESAGGYVSQIQCNERTVSCDSREYHVQINN